MIDWRLQRTETLENEAFASKEAGREAFREVELCGLRSGHTKRERMRESLRQKRMHGIVTEIFHA
jgi:hypothetical protein